MADLKLARYAVNTQFGLSTDLLALSEALHARNMYLMVDIVVNNMVRRSCFYKSTSTKKVNKVTLPTKAYDGPGTNVDYSIFNPFPSEIYFHPYCLISNYSNQTNVEDCWEGDTIVSLPDLDTTQTFVQDTWNSWVKSFVSNYSSTYYIPSSPVQFRN